MKDKHQQKTIIDLIARHTNADGLTVSPLPMVSFYRYTDVNKPIPSVYEPSLCIIVQGSKDVMLGKDVYGYGAMEFLVASVNLPIIGNITEASQSKPYFVLQVDIDVKQISELLSSMKKTPVTSKKTELGLFIGEVDKGLAESVVRLLQLMDTPDDIPILAESIRREVYYRMLCSEYGDAISQIALKGSPMHRISMAIKKLRQDFSRSISVDELAALSDMSVSSFHAHFKSVTNMSPLQFQKSIRLMEARNLMISNSLDAASTAYRVGYESPSQFSREYSRMFGNPPARDVEQLR